MSNTQDLERQIEELAECHRAVRGAVARAFEASSGDAAPRRRRVRSQVGNAKRLTPEEVAALGERLYADISRRTLFDYIARLRREGDERQADTRSHLSRELPVRYPYIPA